MCDSRRSKLQTTKIFTQTYSFEDTDYANDFKYSQTSHLSHCQQELLSSTTTAITAATTAAMTSTEATAIASNIERAAATDGHQLECLPTSTKDTMPSFCCWIASRKL
jgi:hypothetical protein